MVYRIRYRIILHLFALLVTSLYYCGTLLYANPSPSKYLLIGMVTAIIGYNVIAFKFRWIEIEGDKMTLHSIYGKKTVMASEVEEVAIIKLKGRFTLLLADAHKFVFISSFYEGFDKIVEFLKDRVTDQARVPLEKLDFKEIKKRRVVFKGVMLVLIFFFIGAGTYNLFNN